MSTYEDDHNIQREDSSRTRLRRAHPTLAGVLESFFGSDSSSNNMLSLLSDIIDLDSEIGRNMLEALQLPRLPGDTQVGMPQSFLDELDRVTPQELLPDQECPICTNKFSDDPHPLVVKLPCTAARNRQQRPGKDHVFDLECIGPWLKVNDTCPLCRYSMHEHQKLWKEELEKLEAEEEEEEEEGWDVYG